MEFIQKAWERLQEYILACPHHGMDEWLVLQSFYNGLTMTFRANIDAVAGGAFLDLTLAKAKELVEKMCWYFLTLTEKSASARKYRCSTSPGSICDTLGVCTIKLHLFPVLHV